MLRAIENKVDASEVESFILPLLLYKYLSDTFDEVGAIPCVEEDLNNGGTAGHVWRAKTEREPFSFPGKFRWEAICNYPPDGTLGQFLTAAMREMAYLNPFLRG